MELTIMKVALSIKDESPCFGENTIHVEIDDEAGGPFLSIRNVDQDRGLRIDFDQFDDLIKAVAMLRNQSKVTP